MERALEQSDVEMWPFVSGGFTVLMLLIDNPFIADIFS